MRLYQVVTLLLLFPIVMLGGACGKKTVEHGDVSDTLKPEGYAIEGVPTDVAGEDRFGAGELESLDKTGVNPLEYEPNSAEYREVYGRSTPPLLPVYFDFDSSSINVSQFDILNKSGRYLLENSSVVLLIEGNCDERGTLEYNLALGERRANSVKKYFINMGVAKERLTTISYGSERPLFPGSSEEAWAKNRRADLIKK